jgi:hypothetical protein
MNLALSLFRAVRAKALRTPLSHGRSAVVYAVVAVLGGLLFAVRDKLWAINARVFRSRSTNRDEGPGEQIYFFCYVVLPLCPRSGRTCRIHRKPPAHVTFRVPVASTSDAPRARRATRRGPRMNSCAREERTHDRHQRRDPSTDPRHRVRSDEAARPGRVNTRILSRTWTTTHHPSSFGSSAYSAATGERVVEASIGSNPRGCIDASSTTAQHV